MDRGARPETGQFTEPRAGEGTTRRLDDTASVRHRSSVSKALSSQAMPRSHSSQRASAYLPARGSRRRSRRPLGVRLTRAKRSSTATKPRKRLSGQSSMSRVSATRTTESAGALRSCGGRERRRPRPRSERRRDRHARARREGSRRRSTPPRPPWLHRLAGHHVEDGQRVASAVAQAASDARATAPSNMTLQLLWRICAPTGCPAASPSRLTRNAERKRSRTPHSGLERFSPLEIDRHD